MRKFTFNTDLPENIPLLLKKRALEISSVRLQAAKNAQGKFEFYTYEQVYEEVIMFAKALKEIGITRGSNVALISDNRREWLITDFAVLTLGAADVPRGCDSMGNEIRFIISFSECKFGFFENFKQLKKVLEKQEEVPLLKTAILYEHMSFEERDSVKDCGIRIVYFDELMKTGRDLYEKNKKSVREEMELEMSVTHGMDVATIIFTSGTTGTPKGVMLTHKNYMSQLSVIHNYVPCKKGDWWMTILPVWHSFERLIQYVAPLMKCGLAYSKPAAPVLLPDMAEMRPQWMCGVPRLWEALANGVFRAMDKKGGMTKKLFYFFVSVGEAYAHQKDKVCGNISRFKFRSRTLDCVSALIPFVLLWPLHKLGDALVFKKIRGKFGGRIKIAVSGGGALQPDIDKFYKAIGLNLLEGYGLSETSPVLSFRDYKHPRSGCVGIKFPTMELKVVKEEHGVIVDPKPLGYGEQGMILVRGPQIMKGYYNRPDLTEKIIDKDGWLNTGDLGMLTFDNEIKITGRAKDTIVLLDGENIEPAVIESALLASDFIESAIVLGQDKKYLSSLIVPAKENLVNWAKQNSLSFTEYTELLKNERVISLFNNEVSSRVSLKNGFRVCEKIYKFILLPASFTVGQELSAKQEMIRYRICEKYASEIEKMY